MQCVILIGGLGTRLGKLVSESPKPMLPVAERPFLDYLLENVARYEFKDILLLAGYRADVVQAYVNAPDNIFARLGLRVDIVVEPEPLGTGGALRHARDRLADEFLMMNGDSLLDFNLLDLITFPLSGPWTARMALRRVDDVSRYGVVSFGADGLITNMRERPDLSATGQPGLVNGGVYWLKREIVELLPDGVSSIERKIFPALATQQRLYGREYHGFFLDIGLPQDYSAAQELLPLRRPAVFFDRDGVLNHDDGYTHRIEDFRWTEDAIEAVKAVNDANWFVFVVTNQAGVARGLYDESQVVALHGWMNATLHAKGAHIDDFRYCPHHPDGAILCYAKSCSCRKPKPGMIIDLLKKWPVDRRQTLLIGDSEIDARAAKAAGIKTVFFDGSALLQKVRGALA